MPQNILPRSFYNRNTLNIAQDLLGCFLVRRLDSGEVIKARIMEAEAYIGQNDLACHACKGRTKRTEIMFGPAGHWYVYMIYGMYFMLNVVTEKKDFPAAVLIRAVDFDPASLKLRRASVLNGPGKLTKRLQIDKKLNGAKAFSRQSGLWITEDGLLPGEKIIASKRIGVDYAGEWKEKEWRFILK